MTTKQHREIYNKNLLHPWGDLSELGNDESSSVIVKGKGIHIFDSDGNKMIDGPAGYVVYANWIWEKRDC